MCIIIIQKVNESIIILKLGNKNFKDLDIFIMVNFVNMLNS